MRSSYRIEVREQGKAPRPLEIDAPLDIGREGDGLILDDPRVSRRHGRLVPSEGELTLVDLNSTNGTWLNEARLVGERAVKPGDRIRIGGTELVVLGPPPSSPPTLADQMLRPTGAPRAPDLPSNPMDELLAREVEGAVIRYRPGTAGEEAVAGMTRAVRRAMRRLEGLGAAPQRGPIQLFLVDPFPDPDEPGAIVAGGTLVDTDRGEIWMVVTSESPPEAPERPMALLLGAVLPAGPNLTMFLEGYGLHLAGVANPDPELREADLPRLGQAEGELGSAMALSFVRYLLEQGSRDDFLRFLAEARPGRIDAAVQDVYGRSLSALEDAWSEALATGEPEVEPRQFLRLTLRYLRPHLRREVEMFVYMLFGLGFNVVFPFAFRNLIDEAIPGGRFADVLEIMLLLAAAFLVSLVADLRRAYLSAFVSSSVVRQIQADMFGRLQRLDAGWFHAHHQGDTVSRLFSDVSNVEQGLSQSLREGVFQVISLVVSGVIMIALDPLLGVIVLAGSPLIAMVYKVMGKKMQKRSLAVQDQVGGVYTIVSENYGAQPVVKAFALEERESSRFDRATQRLLRAQVRLSLTGGMFGLWVNVVVTWMRLFVIGLGAWLVLEGRFTVGGLVAFIGVMSEVLTPVTVLTGIGEQIQASGGSLLRINEILAAVPEVADDPDAEPLPPLEREIRLESVAFSYTPEIRTLEGIDAVIPAGSRVAFVGPTGAGKSSVLQLLMRFYDPDEGSVTFDGRDLRSVRLASLRSQLGVVFQDTFLFDTTIGENIAVGKPGATQEEVETAARAAELHDFVLTLPRGYDTTVGERGARLSGGQRQRLALARALLRDPRVLLLDEATSALDPRTERLIATTLERVGKGRTTISVTHRLTSVTDYDQIFVVVGGKLVEAGTHAELIATDGVYAGLWAEQTRGDMPAEPLFDAQRALARVPVFGGLEPDELARAAARLRTVELGTDESLAEGDGSLVLIRRGRATVLAPGIGGIPVAVTELGPGDAFGVAALLGASSGATLIAREPVTLAVLDADAIAAVAAAFPAVEALLLGTGVPATVRPSGGRRLSRLSVSSLAVPAMAPGAQPRASAAVPAASAGSSPFRTGRE